MNMISEKLGYENTEYGIKMTYSDNWVLNENIPNVLAVLTERKLESLNTKEETNYSSGSSNVDDGFITNINIAHQDLTSRPMGVDMYIDFNVNYLKSILVNFQLLTRENIEVSGNPARRITYKGKYKGIYDLKFSQIVTVKDKKAYAITYAARENTFDNDICDFYGIVSTFQIK